MLTDQEFATPEADAQSNPRALNQLEITRKNHRALGTKGILAWDLVRYIAVCRWGYLAGYLTETEAWDHIMPAAPNPWTMDLKVAAPLPINAN
jgi:hypothetical protein